MFIFHYEVVTVPLLSVAMFGLLMRLSTKLDSSYLRGVRFERGRTRRFKLILGGLVVFPLIVVAGSAFPQSPAAVPPAAGTPQTAARGRGFVRRPLVFETIPPQLPSNLNEMAVLIFSKTQAYRYDDAMEASNGALLAIAQQNGWTAFQTENGAVFNADMLSKFKVVVWNNTSGDLLNEDQEQALRKWIESGGGWVGIHNAAGDRKYQWSWYSETLLDAEFMGHAPLQWATIHVEDKNHPATRGLGDTWSRSDEWYSFAENPRTKGVHVLLTVDENSYSPAANVKMGSDHPVAWWHCVGKGRAFFTALGHRPSAYLEPAFRQHLTGAISWAAGIEGEAPGCSDQMSAQ
jgi:type 1 glutamine amidotransferase